MNESHLSTMQIRDQAQELRVAWLKARDIEITSAHLFDHAGAERFDPHNTALEELSECIRDESDGQIGFIVACCADSHKLDRIAHYIETSLDSEAVKSCITALKVLREAHRRRKVLHMQLQDYVYINRRSLAPWQNELREEGSWPLHEDKAPFWYELGQACLSLLTPYKDKTALESEAIRTRLLQHCHSLIELENALPHLPESNSRSDMSPLLLMTLSNYGQHFIEDVKLIRAITEARPGGARIDPTSFHALPSGFTPTAPHLSGAISTVARNYGKVLGWNDGSLARRSDPRLNTRQAWIYTPHR